MRFHTKALIIAITIISLIFISKFKTKINDHKFPSEEDINNVSTNSELDASIQEIFDKRNKAILENDVEYLESIFDLDTKFGTWAYEHEIKKIEYISNWEKKQGVKFTEIKPKVSVRKVEDKGEKSTVTLICLTEYKYVYEDDKDKVNTSKIEVYHVLDVVECDDSLVITKEWYNDPFADSLNLESFNQELTSKFITGQEPKDLSDLNERRQSAVDYAHKYSFKYNKDYKNYNYEGGDCTNFISQVLHEGGGFEKDYTWNYSSSGGTKAWVNAQGFKDYVVYNGKGSLVVNGDYEKVYKNSFDLLPGDIISYEKKGRIAHTAVVTALDSKGYPLVTCHNTDRYDVPWDLGWNDDNIKFWFIRVNY